MSVTYSALYWRIIAYVLHVGVGAIILKVLHFVLPHCITSYYTSAANVLLFMVLVQFTFEFSKKWYFTKEITPDGKAVFITGCESGFGHFLAKRLDSRGFHVFASCLNPSADGATELQASCSSRLHVLELDVTKEESVSSAFRYVKDNLGNLELWAVVNNSGIQKGFGVMMSSVKDFEDTLQVNTFGLVRVTKAFLSLLRKSKGRVVNVTALCGRIPVPYFCPYVMSKFAAVAFTECLRYEMEDWGVTVIGVEPELFKTPISDFRNVSERIIDSVAQMDEDNKALFTKEYLRAFRSATKNILSTGSERTEIVVDELESAICLENPDSLHKPRRNALTFTFLYIAERLPRTLQDCLIYAGVYLCGIPKPAKAPMYQYLLNKKGQ